MPALDGLRGIAVMMVMATHFWQQCVKNTKAGAGEHLYAGIAQLGVVGVDLFFVLSGFLITSILFRARNEPHYYRAFFARRVVRIFPLYYFSLALFFLGVPAVLHLLGMQKMGLLPLFQAPAPLLLAFLVNWAPFFVPNVTLVSPLLQHFWSLAIEEHFYLVWPWCVKHLTRRNAMMLCVGLTAVSFVLRLHYQSLGLTNVAFKWTFCQMDGLAIGAFIGLGFQDGHDRGLLARAAPYTGAAAFLLLCFLPNAYWQWLEATLFPLFFASCLVLALSSGEKSPLVRGLSSRGLRFLGKHSYALYVFHQPIACFMQLAGADADWLNGMLGNRFWAIAGVNLLGFAFSLIASLLSWHLVEKHFLKLKTRKFFDPAAS